MMVTIDQLQPRRRRVHRPAAGVGDPAAKCCRSWSIEPARSAADIMRGNSRTCPNASAPAYRSSRGSDGSPPAAPSVDRARLAVRSVLDLDPWSRRTSARSRGGFDFATMAPPRHSSLSHVHHAQPACRSRCSPLLTDAVRAPGPSGTAARRAGARFYAFVVAAMRWPTLGITVNRRRSRGHRQTETSRRQRGDRVRLVDVIAGLMRDEALGQRRRFDTADDPVLSGRRVASKMPRSTAGYRQSYGYVRFGVAER